MLTSSSSDYLSSQTRNRSPYVSTLIVNADDWGRNVETTDRILDCVAIGTVSSASAMVFMEDSERAAAIAKERRVDCGLHLNFTTRFSAPDCPPLLMEHQAKVSRYLRGHRLAQAFYHPGLASSFRLLVEAQVAEFTRIFGVVPHRLDGHHHMHLCANVLLGELLPEGTIVRRNFSFSPGEKRKINRLYRSAVDRALQRRHKLTDYFYSLPPLEPTGRIERIFSIARQHIVEVETHPINPEEFEFLTGGEFLRRLGDLSLAPAYAVPTRAGTSITARDYRGNHSV